MRSLNHNPCLWFTPATGSQSLIPDANPGPVIWQHWIIWLLSQLRPQRQKHLAFLEIEKKKHMHLGCTDQKLAKLTEATVQKYNQGGKVQMKSTKEQNTERYDT